MSSTPKSRRKLKHTDCFNSPAFIELFKKLRLEGEGSDLNNQPGSNSTVDNIVLQDSTTPSSCDHTTGQAGVPNHTLPKPPRVTLPAENTSPTATVTSGTDRKSRKKFYVVTCGRRTGVFDNWLDVHPLVNKIPGNCHISFDSYELAIEAYEEAKKGGDLHVIWVTTEDELTYGPEKKDAMM